MHTLEAMLNTLNAIWAYGCIYGWLSDRIRVHSRKKTSISNAIDDSIEDFQGLKICGIDGI